MKRMSILLVLLLMTTLACNLTNMMLTPTPGPAPNLNATLTVMAGTPGRQAPLAGTSNVVQGGASFSGAVVSSGTSTAGNSSTPGACTPRADWPIYTVQSGDTLNTIASAVNITPDELQKANCLASPDLIHTGTELHVPVLSRSTTGSSDLSGSTGYTNPSGQTGASVGGNCPNGWFFTFTASVPEANTCPGPIYSSPAAGQNFEGGRVLYYAGINGVIGPSLYVIYNDGSWERYDDQFNGDQQPASDPNLVPPAGRFQPVRAIGKIWRDNPNVRSRLGWAYANEADFPGRRQYAQGGNTLFIDHGFRNLALRLDDALKSWTVVGRYSGAT